jgi:hypothetical protein
MSLQDLYQRFLADPKSAPLAADVALIYVTTTTKVEKPDSVVSHLTKQQQKIVKKKSENVIGVVEGPDSLCLDVDTTLEFVSGGGAYLPSIDDNFLADRVATFPTVGPQYPLIYLSISILRWGSQITNVISPSFV